MWFKRLGSCLALRHTSFPWGRALQEPGVSSQGGSGCDGAPGRPQGRPREALQGWGRRGCKPLRLQREGAAGIDTASRTRARPQIQESIFPPVTPVPAPRGGQHPTSFLAAPPNLPTQQEAQWLHVPRCPGAGSSYLLLSFLFMLPVGGRGRPGPSPPTGCSNF